MDLSANLSGLPGEEAYPTILPDLFRGGAIRIYGRYNREKELVLRLAGNVRGKLKDFVFRGSLPEREPAGSEIAHQWAASKSYDLVSENCALCKDCAYPDNCLFPMERRPSVESCSIDIFQTLRNIGKPFKIAHDVTDEYHCYSIILLE